MRLALIPPIDMLEYTDETDMQLMLPHLLSNDIYRYVYTKHCQDPKQYVILDNGAAEGERIETGDLIKLAHEYDVDEIVIPDVLNDAKATLVEYANFFDYAREDKSLEGLKTMYVLQGNDLGEFFEQARFAATPRFRADVIGIPRHALTTCNDEYIRYELAHFIRAQGCKREIHLLGGNPSYPSELKKFEHTKRTLGIRSTDTSSPFNYASAGAHLHKSYAPVSRPPNYFNLPFEDFDMPILEQNLLKIKEWTRRV